MKSNYEKHKCEKCGAEFDFDVPYIFDGNRCLTTSHISCGENYRGFLITDQNIINKICNLTKKETS